jgi:predicted Zn-dependent protease
MTEPASRTSADIHLEKLRGMVKADPESHFFLTLAEELRKRDESEEAMSVLTAGVRNNPAFAAARLTLGRWLLKDEKFAEARAEFAKVLELSPNDKFAVRYLREAEDKLGGSRGDKVVGVERRLNRFLEGIKKAFADNSPGQAKSGGR